jgi:hypothetical protein
MNSEENKAVPPPVAGSIAVAATRPVKKTKLPMIMGVVVVLVAAHWIFSGPSKAASSGSSADNPVIGEWRLVDPADEAYCPSYQKFTPDESTSTQNGKTFKQKPIYDIKPGVTIVGYGGSYMGEWRPTGPDDMTLGQVGPPPYGVPTFCKYHRQ